jgi:hypothetical protein
VNNSELVPLLTSLAAERTALLQRHEAGARAVAHYDFNNTYQYVIAREETHLTWLRDALSDLGVALPAAASTIPVPDVAKGRRKVEPAAYQAILDDDARHLGVFVERWRGPVAAMTNARHRTMLNVIIGESLEHQRLFEQASAGFEDVLGRRTAGASRTGGVLPTRWVE